MRIGIVLAKTPGYSETFFTSKIEGLKAAGFSVELFVQVKEDHFNLCPATVAPKVSKNVVVQLIKMFWVSLTLLPNISKVFKFISLERGEGNSMHRIFKKIFLNAHILKANLDWLHFGFATITLGSETVAKAIGAKMAISFRGFDMNVYPIKHPNCYRKAWKYADKIHSISQYLYTKALELGLSKKTPYAIIAPAVFLDKLPISKSNFSFSNPILIVTVARVTWIKGLDVAIKAMKLLKIANIQFTYTIIGVGDREHMERYKFLVHENGLVDEVQFIGKLSHSETLDYVKNCDIYLQPSLNEGFCNAVLEAQAMGKLVVASNTGGMSENVIDGKTGVLFDNESHIALFDKIKFLIGLSAEEKNEMVQNAEKRVKDHFDIKKQQQSFVNFYTDTE